MDKAEIPATAKKLAVTEHALVPQQLSKYVHNSIKL